MPPQYKFVEVSPVTAETLEAAVNEWVARGWQLEGIRFVVTEHSKRPQLAFVSFVMETEAIRAIWAPRASQAPRLPRLRISPVPWRPAPGVRIHPGPRPG